MLREAFGPQSRRSSDIHAATRNLVAGVQEHPRPNVTVITLPHVPQARDDARAAGQDTAVVHALSSGRHGVREHVDDVEGDDVGAGQAYHQVAPHTGDPEGAGPEEASAEEDVR